MEKLGDITVQNSFNVTVSCQVDQNLLAKNFTTIINALKELQLAQQKTEAQIKDLSSLKDKVNTLTQKIDRIEKNSSSNRQPSGSIDLIDHNDNLTKRVEKSENNILDNIKDINLINKEITDLKKWLDELRRQNSNYSPSESDKNGNPGYEVTDIAANMSKQLQLNSQKMKDLQARLLKAEESIAQHDKDIKDLQNRDNKSGQSTAPSSSKVEKDLEDFKRDLREKLEIMNRKISNLQSDTDNHEQDIAEIKDILAQHEGNKHEDEAQTENQNKEEGAVVSSKDLSDLRRKIDEVDRRQAKDIKNVLEELNNLKQQLKSQDQKIGSKSLIEEENIKNNANRKSTIQKDDLQDKLNDLILKVNYLEKLISGSKTNIGDDKNPEKLPAINRPKRNPNLTGFQEKDKSGISRKDLGELKAELQAWIKMLFDQNKDKENLEDIELKIQEIKKSLEKKADAEGTKKGFSFLENKITQLYLFLTEPDTEDAMIVRKGFNCLSCSKRVEKLRGKIGPKLNWNNMTTTNYSPPKVGYSKPMGEPSIEREDDL